MVNKSVGYFDENNKYDNKIMNDFINFVNEIYPIEKERDVVQKYYCY